VQANHPAIRRLCLAVDVESFSRRTRPEQLDVQNRLLWTMVQGCRAAGVRPARCDRQDSGDGQILVLPPGVDENKVLPRFVLGLLTGLHRVNNPVGVGSRIRLRVSLGQGAIQIGATGFVAPAVITVCRLLDSNELRNALSSNPTGNAAVVVTDDLYRDMFAQSCGGLPADAFRSVHVSMPAKGFAADAWIQVPSQALLLPDVPAYPDAAELQGHQRQAGGRRFDLAAGAALAWAVFAGSRRLQAVPGGASEQAAGHHDQEHASGDHGPGHDPAEHASAYGEPGHHGLGHEVPGHGGLGHDGLGHDGLGHDGLGHDGLGHLGPGDDGSYHMVGYDHPLGYGGAPGSDDTAGYDDAASHAGHDYTPGLDGTDTPPHHHTY
jgi:hypothetical protein